MFALVLVHGCAARRHVYVERNTLVTSNVIITSFVLVVVTAMLTTITLSVAMLVQSRRASLCSTSTLGYSDPSSFTPHRLRYAAEG